MQRYELSQIFGKKRLCKRGYGSEIAGDVVACGARAEDDHRDLDAPPTSAKLAQKHFAILDGKHQIDDHQVWQLNRALCQRRASVSDCDDREALLLQQHMQHVPNGRIVIEDEDRLFRCHSAIVTGCDSIANMRGLPTSELLSSPYMISAVWFGRRMGAAVLFLSAACAGRAPAPRADVALDPSELYPLSEGNAWSYDVDTGEPSRTLGITRVESFDGRIAEVRTGQTVHRYEVTAEGIRIPSTNVWLVRAPLRAGATWPAPGGRTALLRSMQAHAETEAGSFKGCIEVLETGGQLELEVRTVYCPGVGPVSVESTMRSKVSDRTMTVSARLRGYSVNPLPAAAP